MIDHVFQPTVLALLDSLALSCLYKIHLFIKLVNLLDVLRQFLLPQILRSMQIRFIFIKLSLQILFIVLEIQVIIQHGPVMTAIIC